MFFITEIPSFRFSIRDWFDVYWIYRFIY